MNIVSNISPQERRARKDCLKFSYSAISACSAVNDSVSFMIRLNARNGSFKSLLLNLTEIRLLILSTAKGVKFFVKSSNPPNFKWGYPVLAADNN